MPSPGATLPLTDIASPPNPTPVLPRPEELPHPATRNRAEQPLRRIECEHPWG